MMPRPQDVSVLIPAAGSGQRLGLGPKGWLSLAGRPVIEWVKDKAMKVGQEVIVACPEGVAAPAGCIGVPGGSTGQDSVHRLVSAATKPWLLLWHAARPFGSVQLAQAVLQQVERTGAAGAFLSTEVPCAILDGQQILRVEPAASVASFQTPQAFSRQLLLDVLELAGSQQWRAQSVLELVLRAGHEVTVVPGEKLNIKLTTAEDWLLAQALSGLLE